MNRFYAMTCAAFVAACSISMQAAAMPLDSLTLVGVLDLDVPSGGSDGKALHFLAVENVADLSEYGVGTANNGGGTDGQEYTFPTQSLNAGEHLLLARSTAAMSSYFGACIAEFSTVIEASSDVNQNGDDAIELFHNGAVVQTYGDPDVDGSGMDWEYSDSWAYQEEPGVWTTATPGCSTGATTDASACPYPLCDNAQGVPGCMDDAACNFDPEATVDDLTCTYPGDPCDDGDPMTVFDVLDANCDCSGTPFVPSNAVILTGVIHAGSAPKALEFYVTDDLETLGQYALGTAQNGGGTDGVEWTFPDEAAEAGSFIYVANDPDAFTTFFGFAPTFTDAGAVCNFNGNDAIELFEVGIGVDVFGEIDVDGTGTAWDYTGGWAYRVNGTGPDGMTFVQENWIVSAQGVLDGPVANEFSDDPFPTGTYNTTPDAVAEAEVDLGLNIFPNPTRGEVRISAEVLIDEVRVLDATGREVRTAKSRGPLVVMDFSDLAPGNYTLIVSDSSGASQRTRILRAQ